MGAPLGWRRLDRDDGGGSRTDRDGAPVLVGSRRTHPMKQEIGKQKKKHVFEDYLSDIFDRVRGGERVHILGLGVFYRSTTKAKRTRNPKTGEPMMIAATWRVGFRASKFWKGIL